MPNSPLKNRAPGDGYRPKVTRTLGQRPACLVNASVTYCGNNQIYAFGGFDQYTDEVYNHVLRLDLVSHQWTLVDNYGDIPGVRMGKLSLPPSPPLPPSSSLFLQFQIPPGSMTPYAKLTVLSQVTRQPSTKVTGSWSLVERTSIEPICPT